MGKHEGNCHICGRYSNLTYEHVPPKAALNYAPVKKYSGTNIIMQQQKKITPDTYGLEYRNQQRGSGGYTLCSECNNNTGSYYADHYNSFVNSLYQLLETEYTDYKNNKSMEKGFYPKLKLVSKKIKPLAIFKQIISMFCSTSRVDTYGDEFRTFLIDKESLIFDRKRWLVSIYINTSSRCGSTGLTKVILKNNEYLNVAEIVTSPLGMILYDLYSPCNIEPYLFGCGLTNFSEIPYDSEQNVIIELPFNNGARFVPGFSKKV
ncbi:hypothetical protein [Lacrimispora xylanisolvens]|uniref:hypothetical protein n=1 Tax=Lacrimispora xylanisolvens TaxID=384636 RepID=UPI0024027B74